MSAAQSIRDQGWRQGSLLDTESARVHFGVDGDENERYSDFVVVSHSCDIVCESFDAEPFVELLGRRQINSVDGNFSYAKSPRVLHMRDSSAAYELRMDARHRMPREELADISPSGSLSDKELRTIQRWLSNRYARAAFADEFNRRWSPAKSKISQRLKRDGENLSGIYLLVDGAELPGDKEYEVVLIATMLEEDWADLERRTTCQSALLFVSEQLEACEGVGVIDAELRSEADVSLADLRVLSRWDYDSLSLRDEAASTALSRDD